MSELEQLYQIKSDTEDMGRSAWDMVNTLTEFKETTTYKVPDNVNEALNNVVIGLDVLIAWAQQAIEAIEQGEQPEVPLSVIEKFLQELKLVFEKYSASIEVKSGEAYGESWGGADVLEFTATLDGVTEKKTIALDNSILTAEGM